jgi:adenosine kinase
LSENAIQEVQTGFLTPRCQGSGKTMKIIVSGSMAYDRIMDFPGYFSEHILPEKIHKLNVSFHVNEVKEKFGGTAGNIVYALTLMGESPIIASSIGRDYQPYYEWLDRNRISTEHIQIIENELTACAYITTDLSNNQITGFHPGAMKYPTRLDLDQFDPQDTLVIISPGNLEDMASYPRLCKSRGIDYILDPGQSLPMWEAQELTRAIEGCRILISNDYEMDLIMNKTGKSREALLQLSETLIVTRGEAGSSIYTGNTEIPIPAAKPSKVVDPTGAGDSFRGGLISGLVKGLSIEESARMGSACSSFCLESYGTQEYRFSNEEFNRRLQSCS